MNNSYNLSGFIDLLTTNDKQQDNYTSETTRLLTAETTQNKSDEIIDNFLFSSALTDIYYTD